MHTTSSFVAAALLALPAYAAGPPASGPRVRLDSGLVEGRLDGRVAAFLGIPYAAPPTGEWRWKPPRPAAYWTGTRSARELGPACPQPPRWPEIRRRMVSAFGGDPSGVPPLGPTSEDCLSLNVWTTNLGGKDEQPVMLWLHGGGFVIGSGSDEAASLAPLGVVVVTINYRLGLLGFMAHPALTRESPRHSSGNYGLLDQLEALRWVKRNIAAFGGDPGRITVFGHSSGGDAVLELLASPLGQGLFQRAIAQSSAGGEALPLAEAEAQGLQTAARLQVPTADPLPALRALSVESLLAGAPGGFDAALDGWLLPGPVSRLLAAPGTQVVPLILGATDNEYGLLAQVFGTPLDRTGFRTLLGKAGESRVDRLLALYPAAADGEVPAAATRYLGDRNFVCPTRYVAAQRRGRTWLYLVTAPPAPGPLGARYGAIHGSELRPLFDHELGLPLGEVGRRVGAAMRRYWVRFAAGGDPNEPGLTPWPPYGGQSPQHLELGDPIRTASGLGRPGCDVLDELWEAAPPR